MALFHVDASVISKGKTPGGAVGFACYLTGDAERMQRYLEREGHGREDLVASGAGALPAWAKDGAHFFAMADRYERQGGVVARHYQITLPRELSAQGRLDLAADLRAAFFARYPHVFAVHCPQARDGSGDQPHLHVMFSTRREDVASTRTPKQWFSRAADDGRDPLGGGVRKDRTWDRKHQLQGVRAECAVLINAALEREGIAEAVAQERLRVRGLERNGFWYLPGASEERIAAVAAKRATELADHRRWETLDTLSTWQRYKETHQLSDISREAIVDHVRDRFWLHDHSPAREEERQQSFLRAIDREFVRTGRERSQEHGRSVAQECTRPVVQEHAHSRQHGRQWDGLGQGIDDTAHGGVHVQLDHEREITR